ncbi:hypothetical protein BN946_scf184880.g5 [Trametes cinnabarina]|uniref:Uncharacterized protein n=1 Tax=Pycnoporus cinnabarinus TaxID=5643 RepID=A0A060SJS9_PYCCI|nr:hypothetical protein BN946_scf184880.g5 [Trametes cinnabarina]
MPSKPKLQHNVDIAIDVEQVFKRKTPPSADDLRRDILLLTIANWRSMDGKNKSSASVLKGLSSDERAKLTMLGHISTLLTTGHPTIDAKATVSNAVTGQIHPGSITLVCSLDETNVSGEAKTELIRINAVGDSVSAEPDKSGQELLDNWSTVEDPCVGLLD